MNLKQAIKEALDEHAATQAALPPPLFYPLVECAKALGKDVRSLYTYIGHGKLPRPVQLGGTKGYTPEQWQRIKDQLHVNANFRC